MRKIKIHLYIIIVMMAYCSFSNNKTYNYFLAPLSALDKHVNEAVDIKPVVGIKIVKNSIIRPQVKVHTSKYADFTTDTISTNGAANCTALVFVNKTTKKWSVWHYPLPFHPKDMKKYLIGTLVDPYIAGTLPLAFGSLLSNTKSEDDTALYIFGGGTNADNKQKATNQILSEIFTDLDISEIYDMTPHDEHGSNIILSHLSVGKADTLKNESGAPIAIDYFYGYGDFNIREKSLVTTPRLIGGTNIKKTFHNNTLLISEAA